MLARALCVVVALVVVVAVLPGCSKQSADKPAPPGVAGPAVEPAKPAADPSLVPLKIVLPKPLFRDTPENFPMANVEQLAKKPRPPFLAPTGTVNVALHKTVSASDKEPVLGTLDLVTDGDKEAAEGKHLEMGPGTQWVQIDLGGVCTIHAILIWHYHVNANVVHDVVVQIADDQDFLENVRTLYNNDMDNSSGLGIGKDREYVETYEGRLIPATGARARYVRCYSKGSTSNDQNRCTEVEVHGTPSP